MSVSRHTNSQVKKNNFILLKGIAFVYQQILRRIFFLINPELVHNNIVKTGEVLGKNYVARKITEKIFCYEHPMLQQELSGISFRNPIGLAAGFDYEARLTQTLPSLGFGFHSVGTITNLPCQGNHPPILGRLPRSQSLMVNKGFKNDGSVRTISKLTSLPFQIPIGVSIGKTNIKTIKTQKQSVQDIVEAFIKFEQSLMGHSYYELNISCPNLYGTVSFYPKKNLTDLLKEVDKLCLVRPLFIKMPIDETDKKTLEMMDVIASHSPAGVIIGNLQKNRKDPAFDQTEIVKFPKGNFSGKPTYKRSNELITLAYKHFSRRLDIIGCGGIFTAQDAYEKITLGASLVQLITGMIYMGPQMIKQINMELVDLIKQDGYIHISQAIGSKNT